MKDIQFKIIHCKDGYGNDIFRVKVNWIRWCSLFWATITNMNGAPVEFLSYESAAEYIQERRDTMNRNTNRDKRIFVSEKIV